MEEQERSSSTRLNAAFWRAVKAFRKQSLFPILIALLLLLLPVILFIVNMSASVIEIVTSNYGGFVLASLITVIAVIVFAVFLAIAWGEITVMPLAENNRLQVELAATKSHLATSEARNNDFEVILQTTLREHNRDLLYLFEGYLEKLLSELEQALIFRENVQLINSDLSTTYVQLHPSNKLAVAIPVGRKQGATKDLVYYLYRYIENANSFPPLLGRAVLSEVSESESLAIVEPVDLQSAFWDRVYGECKDQGHGYSLPLKVKPAIHESFQEYEPNTLRAIKRNIEEIIDVVRATSYNAIASNEEG